MPGHAIAIYLLSFIFAYIIITKLFGPAYAWQKRRLCVSLVYIIRVILGATRVAFLTTWCHQGNGKQDKQGLFHTAKVYKQFFNIQTRIT